MTHTTVALTVAGLVLSALVVFGRLIWGLATVIRLLESTIATLQTSLAEQRSADRIEVRDLIEQRFTRHATSCPAREPTGVRAGPE
jgi:hypothetical protein